MIRSKLDQKALLVIIVSVASTLVIGPNRLITESSQVISPNDTGNIPVNIRLDPAHLLHGKDYVPTGTNLTATAEVVDEKVRNLTLKFQWSIKNTTVATIINSTSFTYLFDEPDNDTSLRVLVSHEPNDWGSSEKSLVVRDPVSISGPQGKLFLQHGELLKVSLKFNGTGPFKSCYKFCLEKDVKSKDSDGCKECTPSHESNSTQVDLTQYLREVGNYTLIFVVDNIASRVAKQYSVKITETIRTPTVPYLPIISSITAVMILLIGVALHLKFKKAVYTETADFNFTRHFYEEEEFFNEELSLLERIRYLLFKADEQDMNSSRLSGSRSRLI